MKENTAYFGYSPQQEPTTMGLAEEDKFLLASTAKWAKFISIFMFIMIGLGVLGMLFMMLAMGIAGFSMSDMYSDMYGQQFASIYSNIFWPTMIFCVIYYIAILLPTIYNYRFAQKAHNALATGNEAVMTESFRNLRSSYKASGIILIASVGITILLFVVLIIAAVAAAM